MSRVRIVSCSVSLAVLRPARSALRRRAPPRRRHRRRRPPASARWARRRPRRGPDDDADVDRVVRRRADSRRSTRKPATRCRRRWRGAMSRMARRASSCSCTTSMRRSATGPTTSCTGCCGTFPAATRSLPEGVPQASQLPDGTRQISASGPYYRGPGAAAAGPAHHYVFELFAFDGTIDVPPVGASPPQTRAAVIAAMAGHVRGKGVLVGLFRRTP